MTWRSNGKGSGLITERWWVWLLATTLLCNGCQQLLSGVPLTKPWLNHS